MSKSFTATAGQTWQTLLDEITLAYSERRQALGQSAYTPQANRDVQDLSYWRAMQEWLEANCVNFVDHVNGPLNDEGDYFRFYTVESWRAAAGIPSGGFRRATAWSGSGDPAWSFGLMRDGDIINHWVFQDLQRGFGALRWGDGKNALYSSTRVGHSPEIADQCQVNRALAVNAFAAARWSEWEESDILYMFDARREDSSHWMSVRQRSMAKFNDQIGVSADVTVYGKASAWNQGDGGYFSDPEGLGLMEGVFREYGEPFRLNPGEEKIIYGDTSASPLNVANLFCTVPDTTSQPQSMLQGTLLLKWSFSNT